MRGRTGGVGEDFLNLHTDIPDSLETVLAIFRETPAQEILNPRVEDGWNGFPIGLHLDDARQNLRDILARKRPLPSQHLVEHDAERKDVRAFVDRLALRLLRTHVDGGAENDTRSGRVPAKRWRRRKLALRYLLREGLGEAEVEHFYMTFGIDLDVGWLQVTMDDTLFVCGF